MNNPYRLATQVIMFVVGLGATVAQAATLPALPMLPLEYLGIELGQHEVTQTEWQAVMGTPHDSADCSDCPVTNATVEEVNEYLSRLNAVTGLRYRLPSEREWLEACLAGRKTRFCGGNQATKLGWLAGDRSAQPQPVGQKIPNSWDLYDMTGNALEWTSTCFEALGVRRCIAMGGIWRESAAKARADRRYTLEPTQGAGFRLARTIDSFCVSAPVGAVKGVRAMAGTSEACDSAQGPQGNNWMSYVPDDWSLSRLSMPGTHDSGAYKSAWYNYPIIRTWKTQDLSLREQLNAGVRFLDIRCRHIQNVCAIHHGMVFTEQFLNEVLATIYTFLDENPSESILMSVKEPEWDAEGNTRTFEETFRDYISRNPSKWYLEPTVPLLGSDPKEPLTARGKIVLIRRFAANETLGMNATPSVWPYNSMAATGELSIQDFYNFEKDLHGNYPRKLNFVQSMLEEARTVSYPTMLYLNFTSATVFNLLGIPDIPSVSNLINPALRSYFQDNPTGRYGVVIMDFIDQDSARKIYQSGLPPH